jgi:single-stranded DNA-binding protein
VTLSYWGESNEKASLSVFGCSLEFYGKRSTGDGGGSAPNAYSARQTGNSGNAPQEDHDDEFAGYTQLDDEDLPF